MFKKLALGAAVTLMGTAALPGTAHAKISIGGDSDLRIVAETRVSANSVKKGRAITASATITYSARVLGLPLPATGFYVLSVPLSPFSRPTLLSENAPLESRSFKALYNPYMGKSEWLVRGSSRFWGNMKVHLRASAVSDTRASGYVHGGTGVGHDIDANAAEFVRVR